MLLRFVLPVVSVLLLLPVSGCGPDGDDVSIPPATLPGYQLDPVVANLIDSVKADILADTCFLQQDVSHCSWGEFGFNPGRFSMARSTGEAILIVDDFPSLPPRVMRYHNRIKGYYRVGQNGTVAAVPFSWRAPTTLFHALDAFALPDFVPAESLRPLSQPLRDLFGFYDVGNIGHGSFVLSLLIETNPHQPIVLMDLIRMHGYALEDLCDASGSPESLARLSSKSHQVADELRRVMALHNVRFVNLSAGETLLTLRQQWASSCGGHVPHDDILRAKLNAYTPVADALFNTPGVFAAQAAINASNPQDFPFDFPSPAFPNRMLVGYFTVLDSGLDESGRGGPQVFPDGRSYGTSTSISTVVCSRSVHLPTAKRRCCK
ncbi:hypothetical protein [Myxococcus hansupus]|uniref:hypothetical protein n=1 Tax=Pseudomyxococcus hansupus TaxID=1297742 RepID=UPI000A687C36|nr:hypothetical protein [Myxococcus hansupus]